MPAIEIKNLTKKYKDLTAVDGLNLTVEKGELLALLGVNGAGKTTTVKMLSGLLKPTAGDALLQGQSILTRPDAVKKIIAVSPQETAVAPGLTVLENLMLMCGVHGFKKAQQLQKAQALCSRLGLTPVAPKKAGRLSGGWQRRLSIAMALITEPQILFLDEPTLGLDVLARSELWDLIGGLKGQVTVVLTTHYMEEAEFLADRVAVMKNGRLLQVDTVAALKQQTGTQSLEAAFIKMVKGEKA